MTKLLLKLPWFFSAPAVLVIAGVFAWLGYAFTGDYFNETCVNERNPLTGEFAPSNCGEGAKVAKRLREASAQPTPAAAAGDVVARGTFRDGDPGHQGSGAAELQRLAGGRLNLLLSNFSVTNGPDLFVVLSKDAEGRYSGDDLVLEPRLKANNGTQNYDVPAGTDTSQFRSVIIWCRQFRVTFAYAPLGDGAAVQAPAATPSAAGATATPAPASTPTPTPTRAANAPTSASSSTPTPTPAAAATTTPTGSQPTQPPATSTASPTPTPRPAPTATPTPTPAPSQGPGVVARGQFRDGDPGHTGRGTVELQRLADGSLNAFLSNFAVTNGPDLFVVLSTSASGDYRDGDLVLQPRLKANNGNQNYVIPPGTDLSAFRSVIIWCKSFDVTFAYAVLGGGQ
ncbi:MAG: DM13 domain-containing protein [Dehalococcoidia bacterium]